MPDVTDGTVGEGTDSLALCQLDPNRTNHLLIRGSVRPGIRVPQIGSPPKLLTRIPELFPEQSDFQPSFVQSANLALEMGGS